MDNTQQKIKKLLLFQLIINIFFAIWCIYYEGKNIFKNWNIWNPVFILSGLVIAAILFILRSRGPILANISKLVDIIFLPFSFIYLFNFVCVVLGDYLNSSFFFFLLYVIAPLFIFIPVVKVDYENIQSNLGRILSIQIICEIFVLTNYKVDSNKILDNVNRSQIIFSIFLVLFAYLVLKRWGYHFYLGLKLNNQFQWKVFIPILLFGFYMVFFNAFLTTNPKSIGELIWKWNFEWLNPAESQYFGSSLEVFLNAADAGITEEVWRYLTIVILLVMLKNNKHKISLTILISSLLFGLLHFNQLLSPDRNLTDVIIQSLGAVGLGIFLGSLFLYSGQIWLNVLFHFLFDLVVFSLTPLSFVGSGILTIFNSPALAHVIITSGLFILVSVILITGKRRKCVENNIERLIMHEN